MGEYFSNPETCSQSTANRQLKNLIQMICQLQTSPISDPQILQKFNFKTSYEILSRLEKNPPTGMKEQITCWKDDLIKLDIKAYHTNQFYNRPSARWVIHEARSIPAKPTKDMLEGHIEREQATAFTSPTGETCRQSKKGCEKVRYVLLKLLVPGYENPAEVRERLHSFSPCLANRRVTDYLEVPLEKKTLLLRRNYQIKPLPGYKGTMENYHQLVFRDKQRIVILEENTRVGKFIKRTDNAAAYIRSPPYGVTIAFIFTGKYAMESFFRAMIGTKTMEEPVEVMAILRQYLLHPDKGEAYAVEAGKKEYKENQKR